MKVCPQRSVRSWLGLLAMGLGIAWTTATASIEQLRQAEEMINAGRFTDAMVILEPLELEYIGDARYDYLAGLALLETGEAGRAILALERAIATDPRFAGAQLDLARAYYASGAYSEAQREFESLRDRNPPPAARQTIEEYLSLIANQQRRLRFEYRLGTRAGFDSNANSATSVNDFLGFDLNEQSRAKSSAFGVVSGSARVLKPLSASLLLDSRIRINARNNPDASFVNSRNVGASAGIRHVREGVSRSLQLQAYQVDVDGRLNSEGLALAGSWQFRVRQKTLLGVFGRLGRTEYGEDLRVKDVNQYLLGVSANWSIGVGDRGSLGASLLFGNDDPLQSESRYARDIYGLRVNAGWNFSPQFKAQVTAGILQADYDEIFFEQRFDAPRSDTLTEASVKLDWRLSPQWLMSHVVAYMHNDTEVSVFEFERVETSLSISRVWR